MQEGTQEVRYKAKVIHEMLNDDINYLYMIFLSPFVPEFEKVNAFFQSTNSDPEISHKNIKALILMFRFVLGTIKMHFLSYIHLHLYFYK